MHRLRLIAMLPALWLMHSLAHAQPQKVPVQVWADSNQVSQVDMSPNAERMAMLMRRERGARPELMIFEKEDVAGTLRAIQPEGLVPVSLRWANDEYLIVNFIFETDDKGRPVYLSRSASFNIETGEWTSLIRTTNRRDIRGSESSLLRKLGVGRVVNILADEPDHVLIAHNEEQGKPPNYYRINLENGNRTLVLKGNTRFSDYVWDRDGQARGATEYDSRSNSIVSMARMSSDDDWTEVGRQRADSRDRFGLLGFYDSERPWLATIVADKDDGNHTGIYQIDIRNGERELLFRTRGFDAIDVIQSPRLSDGSRVVGFRYSDRKGYQSYYVDDGYRALHEGLKKAFPDRNVEIERVSTDGSTTLVYTSGPRDPGSWYLVQNGQVAPVISRSTELESESLSPVEIVEYKTRDGLDVFGYLTVPAGMEGPLPTIAMPHGGPWVRDTYDYDEWAQMLANRGYVVFQPNYRGSVELGKSFWMAGDNKWGHEMQNDIEDGLHELVDRGIADPEKLAIFGWSYGGYAAFVAATREDPMFNCIVSGAGVSDLSRIRGGLSGNRFLRQYQKPTISGVSPIERAGNVARPMLIVHGDYDSVVPVEHSRRFVSRLEEIGADFQYIEIENMGHSPTLYEQNMQWYPKLFEFFETKCGF